MVTATKADLKNFAQKRVIIQINLERFLSGKLIGYDSFMNVTLMEPTFIHRKVSQPIKGNVVIRGASIKAIELDSHAQKHA